MAGARGIIEALPPDFFITLVDVGSAGGLHPRWQPFEPLLSSILFDPREGEASGELGRGRSRVYPVALGSHRGEAMLHQTAMANMSSFLEPDAERFSGLGSKSDDARVIGTTMVAIERLDDIVARDEFRPDIAKIDTQGSELMVLEGAGEALASVALAEVEVSFFQRYRGQPLLADIERHMQGRGFELIDLHKLKRYRYANRTGIRNEAARHPERSGRLAYADALFLRREEELHGLGAQGLRSAAVALVAYGKGDMAARLVETGAGLLPKGEAEAICHAIRKLGRFLPRLLGMAT